ncbi:MAG: hypothetical protein R2849_22575 [Thermomicrobiales bacterium]
MTIDVVGGSAMSNGDVGERWSQCFHGGRYDRREWLGKPGTAIGKLLADFNGNRPGVDNPFGGVVARSPVSMVDWAEEDD